MQDAHCTITSPAFHSRLNSTVFTPCVALLRMTHSSTSALTSEATRARTSPSRRRAVFRRKRSGFCSAWRASFSVAWRTGRGREPYEPVHGTQCLRDKQEGDAHHD
jgi:hypothetical protein